MSDRSNGSQPSDQLTGDQVEDSTSCKVAKASKDEASPSARCPMCLRLSHRFCCCTCINDSFGFWQKKATLSRLIVERDRMAELCDEKLTKRNWNYRYVVVAMDHVRPRLAALKRLLRMKTKELEAKRRFLSELIDEMSYRTEVVSYLQTVCKKFGQQSQERLQQAEQCELQLISCQEELGQARCKMVTRLLEDVFPIEVVMTTPEENVAPLEDSKPCVEEEPVLTEALLEATMVQFCYDRWIPMDNASKVQFKFVDSCLAPDNSDYSVLKQFLFSQNTDMPSVTDCLFTISKAAFGSCPSLAYAAQLTALLARVLDVRLPFVVRPTDFCLENICKDEFETATLKLNANVVVLCSSQMGDEKAFSLLRPFWNLVTLRAGAHDLGRPRSYAASADCIADFAEAVSLVNWCEKPSPLESGQTDIDDWESVSESLPEWNAGGYAVTNIINSATSSVALLLKAMQL
uniref:Beclin 1-associated autophagy-related key regulator n=1 Tax=Trichuris muris TaxID=70415 RepID=A0A5S6Q864_TRIMR